jgi:hypothetical protein
METQVKHVWVYVNGGGPKAIQITADAYARMVTKTAYQITALTVLGDTVYILYSEPLDAGIAQSTFSTMLFEQLGEIDD